MTGQNVRKIKVGNAFIGGDAPVLIQSMSAARTQNIDAVVASVQRLADAGAGLVRVAVDTEKDAAALPLIRERTTANLSVDLQENFRLAEKTAPYVDKIRYNPGHLGLFERDLPVEKKVEYLVDVAREYDVALRIGVNCGSVDPAVLREYARKIDDCEIDPIDASPFDPLLASALEHVDLLESLNFTRFCVSIKDSDPETVVAVNERFAALRPHVPLHIGVTEAGAPPRGVLKSRVALERLLAKGIGSTLRVSLTVEDEEKTQEVEAAKLIIANAKAGNVADPSLLQDRALNIVSCPSCSRVENGRFVELAREIERATEFARDYPFTIAVMGCRVNGPGETNSADVGLWCGGESVNLKDGEKKLGSYSYEEITEKAVELLRQKIALYNAAQKFEPLRGDEPAA